MAADGHIVLGTKIDTGGVGKGVRSIKDALERLKNSFKSLGKTQIEALTVENAETLARIDEIKKRLAELDEEETKLYEKQTALAESYIPDVDNKDLFENFDPTKAMTDEDLKVYDDLGNKISNISAKINSLKAELEELGDVGKESVEDIESSFGEKLEKAVKKVGDSFETLGKKIASTAKRLLIYQTIYNVMKALIDLMKNILMSDEEFRQDWEELKAALITAAQPLINIIVPTLKTIVSIVRDWAVSIGRIAAALSGMTYKQYVEQAKATKQSADNFADMEDSVKKTAKTLAGFDDIQILSSGKSDESSNDYSGFDSLTAAEDADSTSEVQKTLTAIIGAAGGLLAGIGLLLLTKGQVAWGLGFIIAGAAFWAISEIWGEFDPTSVTSLLESILGTVATLLAGIGLILLTKGQVAWGLGFIIAGAAFWAISEIVDGEFSTDPVLNTLIKVMAIAGTVLAAIGLILICFGQIGWGIAALAAGAVMLVSAVAMSSDMIVQLLQGPLGTIMAIVGGALLVIGIILVCTGAGIPLGLALIAAGAASLVTVIAANKNGILQTIKDVWSGIKSFWNNHIAYIFTGEFWANLGKKIFNGFLAVVEHALNLILGGTRETVNGIINGINFVADLLGADWSIPTFPKITLPRLAQGAVIPANHEFLAVLGDQKNGRNLETPEGLMRQIFREELDSAGGRTTSNSTGSTTVVLEIDGREFGRAVYEYNNKESRRIGTRLVTI